MEFVQERIATLHDFDTGTPEAPVEDAAVVVPMTERDHASLAAERTLRALEAVEPGAVIVPLRAPETGVRAIADWLSGFELDLEVLWCTAEPVRDALAATDLDGRAGKGRDVWLALGLAGAEHPYVVCHDADCRTVDHTAVPTLLAPVARGFDFVKAYYARIENRRLYGRLFRLLYAPLVSVLADRTGAEIVSYLDAFRYALAGEVAMTADVAHSLRAERRFGFEVGTLCDAYRLAGPTGTAQVDLGRYEHDHRAVTGPTGLSDMSLDVAAALFRVLEDAGVSVEFDTLADAYRSRAGDYIGRYAADAAHNGFTYEPADEREQVAQYAGAIQPPGADDRLPAWTEVDLDPTTVREASRRGLQAATA